MTLRPLPDDYPYREFRRRALGYVKDLDKPKKFKDPRSKKKSGYGQSEYDTSEPLYWTEFHRHAEANLVTSAVVPPTFAHPAPLSSRTHLPALDIDFPMRIHKDGGSNPTILFFGKHLDDDAVEDAAGAFKMIGVVDDSYDIFDTVGETGISLAHGAERFISIKSSTNPSHRHLFINVELPHGSYLGTSKSDVTAVSMLAASGLVEQGYWEASIDYGCTALRIHPKP